MNRKLEAAKFQELKISNLSFPTSSRKMIRLRVTDHAITIELVAHNESKFSVTRLVKCSIEESWALSLAGDELQANLLLRLIGAQANLDINHQLVTLTVNRHEMNRKLAAL